MRLTAQQEAHRYHLWPIPCCSRYISQSTLTSIAAFGPPTVNSFQLIEHSKMLASFSGSVAYLLNVWLELIDNSYISPEDVEAFVSPAANLTKATHIEIKSIDMNALSALLPSPRFSLEPCSAYACLSVGAYMQCWTRTWIMLSKYCPSWNLLKGSKETRGPIARKQKLWWDLTCLQNGNVVTRY